MARSNFKFVLVPALMLLATVGFMAGLTQFVTPVSKTENMLQSQCHQYCTSRCAYCPFCSDCLKQVCVQECNCNNQCKGTGFFDHTNNCRCANMNFVDSTPMTLTVTPVSLQIESPPTIKVTRSMNVPTESEMMANLIVDPSDPLSSYFYRH
jgi:hypothetical protein